MANSVNTALKVAATKIRDLEQQLLQSKRSDIAIIGMACRFPDASTPEEFWHNLKNEHCAFKLIDENRFDIERYFSEQIEAPGCFYAPQAAQLDSINSFDYEAFGLSENEASLMDPQHRLLLELVQHGFDNASIDATTMKGSRTGVFVAQGSDDFQHSLSLAQQTERITPNSLLGTARAFSAGRIAYHYGLNGPALQIDTACSSSAVATHLAVESLRNRECDTALVGGVNLFVSEVGFIAFSKLRALSPSGECKTFDDSANGYVRGEGGAILVLKRLDDALQDNDKVLAVIKGSAMNHDGASNGMVAPNGEAQTALIKQCLKNTGIDANSVSYVEAHGTGTPLGDPIELNALNDAYMRQASSTPMLVGSVKTNIGHLEAASGVAGICKTVLALQYKTIPASLHYQTPNRYFDWNKSGIAVADSTVPWEVGASQKRRAGLSSFGMSGTNVHILLEEAPQKAVLASENVPAPVHQILPVSARSKRGVDHQSHSILKGLAQSHDKQAYLETATRLRSQFKHRTAFHLAEGDITELSALNTPNVAGKITFMFSGQGTQFEGMGREIFEHFQVYRDTILQCQEAMAEILPMPLTEVLYGVESRRLKNTQFAQPAIFATSLALARLWQSFGVNPGQVIGHSIGEYAAAVVAGAIELEQAARMVAWRGKMMQALPKGDMLAVFSNLFTTLKYVNDSQAKVSLAAVNHNDQIVLSGDLEAIDEMAARLKREGIFSKKLKVSHAFHSHMMEAMTPGFRVKLEDLQAHKPRIPFISTVTGDVLTDRQLDADYWCEHIVAPVEFSRSVSLLPTLNSTIAFEMGPGNTLSELCNKNNASTSLSVLSGIAPKERAIAVLFQQVAALYKASFPINWQSVNGRSNRFPVPLPAYCFSSLQVESAFSDVAKTAVQSNHKYPLKGKRIPMPFSEEGRFEHYLSIYAPAYMDEHRLFSIPVVAGASHVAMIVTDACEWMQVSTCSLKNIVFERPLVLASTGETTLCQVVFEAADTEHKFMLVSQQSDGNWIRHVQGTVCASTDKSNTHPVCLPERCSQWKETISGSAFYKRFSDFGYNLGPQFCWQDDGWTNGNRVYRQLSPKVGRTTKQFVVHPGLLDSSFQILGAQLLSGENVTVVDEIFIPFQIDQIDFWHDCDPNGVFSALGEVNSQKPYGGNVTLFDDNQRACLYIKGMKTRVMNRALLEQIVGINTPYQKVIWQEAMLSDKVAETKLDFLSPLVLNEDKSLQSAFKESQVALRNVEDMDSDALQEILDSEAEKFQHLVFNMATGENDADALMYGLFKCRSLLQWCIRHRKGFCLVTQNAFTVHSEQSSVNPVGQALAALIKSVALEEGQNVVMHVDIAHAKDVPMALQLISDASELSPICVRDGRYYVQKFVSAGSGKQEEFIAAPDKTHIILGGNGGLAEVALKWLVNKGARHITLVSRSGNVPDHIDTSNFPDVTVQAMPCDCSIREHVETLFKNLNKPVGAVLHLAGVLKDGMFTNQSWEDVVDVLAAKTRGANYLAEQVLANNADLVIGFGSITAQTGAMGQSAYAVANAYMGAYFELLNAQGIRANTIHWGPWGGTGMVASLSEQDKQRLKMLGLGLLSKEQGLQALNDFYCCDDTVPSPIVAVIEKQVSTLSSIAHFPAAAERNNESVRAWLNSHIKQLLGMDLAEDSMDEPLITQGLDSLRAVELTAFLRKQANYELDLNIVLSGLTFSRLVDMLVTGTFSEAQIADDEGAEEGVI